MYGYIVNYKNIINILEAICQPKNLNITTTCITCRLQWS